MNHVNLSQSLAPAALLSSFFNPYLTCLSFASTAARLATASCSCVPPCEAVIMQSACNQHAISMQSACNQSSEHEAPTSPSVSLAPAASRLGLAVSAIAKLFSSAFSQAFTHVTAPVFLRPLFS